MVQVRTVMFAATAVLWEKVALPVAVTNDLCTDIHTEHSYISIFLLYDFLYYMHIAGLNS
jgi:hypothetical protein